MARQVGALLYIDWVRNGRPRSHSDALKGASKKRPTPNENGQSRPGEIEIQRPSGATGPSCYRASLAGVLGGVMRLIFGPVSTRYSSTSSDTSTFFCVWGRCRQSRDCGGSVFILSLRLCCLISEIRRFRPVGFLDSRLLPCLLFGGNSALFGSVNFLFCTYMRHSTRR